MGEKRVVLHLVKSLSGGAGHYSNNIHKHMLAMGYASYICINGQQIVGPDGFHAAVLRKRVRRIFDIAFRFCFRTIVTHFCDIDYTYSPYNLCERFMCHSPIDLLSVLPERPSVIMVHWVSDFANARYIYELQQLTRARVFYWMIDEAQLSGGCHYPFNCSLYKSGCKNCPISDSHIIKNAVRRNYLYKQKYFIHDESLIAPTEFDYIRAKQSLLWGNSKIYKVLEVIDESDFKPASDKAKIKSKFFLPQNKKIVLFGSADLREKRKGTQVLIQAISKISRDDVVFLAAGRNSDIIASCDPRIVPLGPVDLDTLINAYQVSDCFLCGSLEDSGPQMINQSIMCGTPVVAFEMGVAMDIVITRETGYLAKWNNPDDFAKGINYLLDLKEDELSSMSISCREFALAHYSKEVFMKSIKTILN